jgi:UPF0755 protein
MSEPEDRTEPGRARRHARPPAQEGAPPQGSWPARYGPRPDFTVPPGDTSAGPGEAGPPAWPGRHSGSAPVPGWGADPYQNTGLDHGAEPHQNGAPDQNGGPDQGPQVGRRRRPETPNPFASPVPPASPPRQAPPARQNPSAPPARPARQTPPAPPAPQAPSARQAPRSPFTPFTPSGPSGSPAPPVRPGSAAGRPRPGFVPHGSPYPPAQDHTVAHGRPVSYDGHRGRDRDADQFSGRDGYAGQDPYADQDGYAGRADPYGERDGYTGRRRRAGADGYPSQDDGYPGQDDGYPGQDDGYPGQDDGYPGQGGGYPGQDGGHPGQSGPPVRDDRYGAQDNGYAGPDDYEFQETSDYAQHVAGPGRATGNTTGSTAGSAADGTTGRPSRRPDREPGPASQAAPPWDDEDSYEDDDRFVPGLGGPRDTGDYDDNDDEPGRGGRGDRKSGRGGRGGAGGGKRRKRWLIPLVIILVILLLPLGVGGFYAYRFIQGRYYPADYTTGGAGTAIVQVQTGQTAISVGQRLVTLGVVASVRAFELAAEHSTSNTTLEPGFYRMKKHMKATVAYQLLITPSARIQDKITIPEGLRLTQIQAQLGAHSGIPLADYQQALKQPAALGLPSYANGKPEGYLFPATYEVQPNQTAADVFKGMVQRFDQEVANDNLTQAAASVHLTAGQVITMASLIQAEGGSTSYYPQIARVIYNRLGRNMKLQLDSTVMYGLYTFGIIASNQQLQSTSPYNTYRYAGLPPGPIDSPGHAAIEAALHPSPGNDLYFVTTTPKTGLTKFTSSPAQFEQFRQELQQNLGK